MLDTIHTVETPEGVRLALRTAGPVPRALAFAIDALIRSSVYLALSMLLPMLVPDLALPLLALAVFAGEWFYPVAFEVWNRGQTLGKKAVGLQVVRSDGTRVDGSTSLLRNLLLAADWLPGTYAFGLVSMLVSRDFRRIGDHAAGTLVIHTGRAALPAAPPPDLPPLAPPLPLEVEEQQAVLAFAERAALLSDARADELAALAAPLHGGGEPPRRRLLRIGAFLRGADAAPRPAGPAAP